ncbi:MAG: DUF3995 domain-containing protein [Alphaproteobacteria bacterium]|nr:DUF3995 domain-containing protein [Alphaproteobacteria bacterium]
MRALLALLLFVAVGAIAFIHFRWGRGSTWPEADEEQLARAVVGDGRRRMPSPLACYIVAALLALVALWPLYALDHAGELLTLQITFGIAGIFVARGLAGYSRRWREHFTAEPFATRDRRYYSPLCLLLGAAYAALVIGEIK